MDSPAILTTASFAAAASACRSSRLDSLDRLDRLRVALVDFLWHVGMMNDPETMSQHVSQTKVIKDPK